MASLQQITKKIQIRNGEAQDADWYSWVRTQTDQECTTITWARTQTDTPDQDADWSGAPLIKQEKKIKRYLDL